MIHLPDRPSQQTTDFQELPGSPAIPQYRRDGDCVRECRQPALHASGFAGGRRHYSSFPRQYSRRRTCRPAQTRTGDPVAR